MKRKDYFLIVALIIVDQITKGLICNQLTLNKSIEVIKNFFYITYVRNDGAAFSILSGQRWLFVALAIVAVYLMIRYVNKNKADRLEKFSIVLIIAGAIGNVLDRIIYGTVVDFLDFLIFGYDFPVFNFADICITIGVGLLFICVLFDKEAKTK